ncbi:MAG: hypothetical protein U0822_14315 [Anaerolineae bacterium]
MIRAALRPYYVMGALIAACLAVAAGAGLLNPDIYRPFIPSDAIFVGLPVQDLVSLLAAPLLVVAMVYTARGSARALVIWAGLLVFAAYYYAFFCFGFTYTVFYPLYIAIMGLGVYSLLGLLTGVDVTAFAARVDERMPVRFIAVVLAMPLLLVPLWLMGIAHGISTQQPGAADLVFALDLAFLIPAMAFAAVQIWQRRPLGYMLGGVLLVKATISGILLTGGSIRQFVLGFAVGPDFAMYVFLAVAGLAALALYLWHLHDEPRAVNAAARHVVSH